MQVKVPTALIVFDFWNYQDTGWKTANEFHFSHLFSTVTNSSSNLRWHPNLCRQKCFPVTRSCPAQDMYFIFIFMFLIFLVASYCCCVFCWVSSSPPEELCGLLSIPVLNPLLFFFCLISLHTLICEWNFTSSLCTGDSCTLPSLPDQILV